MKTCCKCKIEKELSEFHKKGKSYSYHCKDCQRTYVNEHYKNNKQYYKDKSQITNKKYRNSYNEYKESLNCTDCRISFKDKAYLCDFHHLDHNKEHNVANIATSLITFLNEVCKCVPLCANCHRTRHHRHS